MKQYLLPKGSKIRRKKAGKRFGEEFITTKDAIYDEKELRPGRIGRGIALVSLPPSAYPWVLLVIWRADLVEVINHATP